jgi:hypothetical protein
MEDAGRIVGTGGHRRILREKKTVEAMLRIYCRGVHGGAGGLCAGCSGLLEYARARLDRCRYRELKPACGKCPVHCYKPSMRAKIIRVMRYSGPRMSWRHPALALYHFMDSRREVPEKPVFPRKQPS